MNRGWAELVADGERIIDRQMRMRCEYAGRQAHADSSWWHDAWRVKLLRTVPGGGRHTYQLTFRLGLGHERRTPSVREVLGASFADGELWASTGSAEDMAADLGMPFEDRAERQQAARLFAECGRARAALLRLFPGDDYAAVEAALNEGGWL